MVAIFCFEQNSFWVEKYYSNGIYKFTSIAQRVLFSWLPFSIGDVLYILISIYILVKIVKFIKRIITEKERLSIVKKAVGKTIQSAAIAFIVFKLLWGINYSRVGVTQQFDLHKSNYTKDELVELTTDLIFDANYCRKQIADTNLPQLNIDSIFIETENCYAKISKYYPFLTVKQFAVKPSLYSVAGNYLGYTGYYNPFTGEAQVRSDLPKILLPFICCHEVAHQLGYASEEEANFIGFLAANESNNIAFRYSLDLELLDYAQHELMVKFFSEMDVKGFITTSYSMRDCMSKQVKKDRKQIKEFFIANRKDISNVSNFVYDKYLKANKQPTGITSYNTVIDWVLNYRKKFRK